MPKETEIKLKGREKILLYLSLLENYEHLKSSLITQQGIAEAIDISRPRVTKILRELIDKEHIKQEIGYIEKKHREVKIHSLTSKGHFHAIEIEREIDKNSILFKNFDGITKRVNISKIINDLEIQLGFKPSILEILDNVKDDILDIDGLKEKIKKQRETRILGKKIFINNLPDSLPFTNFYGREKELEILKNCIESEKCKIMVVRSFPGMGKTALGFKLAEKYKDKINIFWFEIQNWNSLGCLLKPFSEFLSRLNKTKLKDYIFNTQKIDLNDVSDFLEEDLKDTNILIVFDDCQKAIEEIVQFFEAMKFLFQKTKNSKIILLSRKALNFYDRRDVKIKKIVSEIELNGLDENASIEFLSSRGISQSICQSLYKITKGYPLALEVIDETHETKEPIELTRFISEAITFLRDVVISKMNDNEKKLMEISSVYRKPVPKDAIIFSDEFNHDTIDGLVNKSLLKEFNREEYSMHEMLRELFYERLTYDSRKTYHLIAASFSQKISCELNFLEAIYHFIKAEEFEKGAKIAIEQCSNLISKGYANELMQVLLEFNEKNISQKQFVNILVLKGDVTFVTVNWDDALKYYCEAIELGKNIENGAIATAYQNMGHIKREKGKWEEALKSYQKAMIISEKVKNIHGIADTYRGIGKVYWRLGSIEKAKKSFNKCLEYAKKNNEILTIAKTYNDLGNIYGDQNKFDKAIEYQKMALDLLDKKEDIYERARAYNNIGVSYYQKDNYEKALEYWEKCIELSQSLGSTSTRAWALLNASDVNIRNKNFKQGLEYLNKSQKIMEKLENKLGISQVYLTYGRIYRNTKNFPKAKIYLEMSIEIAENLHSPFNLAERYFELGLIFKDEGNPKKTRFYLKKVLKIYEELGEKKLVNKVNEVLNELEIKKRKIENI